ncbi:MAG: hypothetical protein ACJAYU_001268 [Bradymonadia bacterium]
MVGGCGIHAVSGRGSDYEGGPGGVGDLRPEWSEKESRCVESVILSDEIELAAKSAIAIDRGSVCRLVKSLECHLEDLIGVQLGRILFRKPLA